MKTRTVREMYDFLKTMVDDGYGDARILFDTEARQFNYHMAAIGSAYHLPEEAIGEDSGWITLHEEEQTLVIGQNPAISSKTGEPFRGTKTWEKLRALLKKAGVHSYSLSNVSDKKTIGNKPLKRSEMNKIAKSQEFLQKIYGYHRILAIGRQAELTIRIAKHDHPGELSHVKFIYVPHPSGLNRAYNSPEKEQEVIEMIKVFMDDEGIKV